MALADEELGWFQAPTNVGYAVIGLLWGEGDFKKTMIYTINCGDDTDCTAGTVGAVLGIVNGTAGIPADWQAYIGDRIIQKCINGHFLHWVPKTCTEFTDKILAMIPSLLEANGVAFSYGEQERYCQKEAFAVLENYSANFWSRSPYSFDINYPHCLGATVEYEAEPVVCPGESFPIKITFRHLGKWSGEMLHCSAYLYLPAGWSADYRKNVYISRGCDIFETPGQNPHGIHQNELRITVTPGECVDAQNKLFLVLTSPMYTHPFTVPITLLG